MRSRNQEEASVAAATEKTRAAEQVIPPGALLLEPYWSISGGERQAGKSAPTLMHSCQPWTHSSTQAVWSRMAWMSRRMLMMVQILR
jgi:hypothetical protein